MSINEYGLDADYFIKLCAREFSPEVIRNQCPADLARAFARAARTACADVLDEREFSSAAAEQPYSTTSDKYRTEQPDGHSEAWPKAGDRCLCPACCRHRKSTEQPDTVKVPRELPAITDRLARFIETVRGCERLASDYSGSLDGVDEHGGDDHDDPICAVFHRLYYAMFDGDKLLAELRALLGKEGDA